MKLNPEFLRNYRIQMAPRRTLFSAGLTVTLIIVAGALLWFSIDPYSRLSFSQQIRDFGETFFGLLVGAQFIFLHVMASGAAGGSFVQERVRGTLIFQQMTLLEPREMLLGKLFGSTVFYYFLTAVVMPFALIAALLGGVELEKLIYVYAMLFVGGLCWQSLGLFVSAALTNATETAGRNFAGMGYGMSGIAAVMSLSMTPAVLETASEPIRFYGIPVPLIGIALGLAAFAGAWAFAGAVRAFKQLQLMSLSPLPVWGFFASLEAVLLGLFWKGYLIAPHHQPDYFHRSYAIGIIIFYLFINWLALTALVGCSAIARNQLREWWSAQQDSASLLKRAEIRNILLTYPLALLISIVGLGALWFSLDLRASMTGLDWSTQGLTLTAFVATAKGFLITAAAMAGFIQFWTMHRFRAANQAGAALFVLFFVVMGIAAAIAGDKSVFALINPLLLAAQAIDRPTDFLLIVKGLAVESGFAAVCIGLAVWKWRRTRREMLAQ